MKATFYVNSKKLKMLQEVVKQHNLRFVGNPCKIGYEHQVTISSDHLEPGAENAFFADWNRLNTEIRETIRKPRLIVRIRRAFTSLFNLVRLS